MSEQGVIKSQALAALAALWLCLAGGCAHSPRPLASWNEGPTRDRLIEFVEQVSTPGGPGFVRPSERIAVFDNDGTLWSEQPAYVQLVFAVDRVRELAPQHPEWSSTEPFRSAIAGDWASLKAQGHKGISNLVMATHAGMTAEEFKRVVRAWLQRSVHPTTGQRYDEMVYLPMLELLDHLRAHGFKTFIVSGGGIDFVRVFAEEAYGIPPEQVIGSTIRTRFEMGDSGPVINRLAELDFIDDKEGKPVAIERFIGRRPIAAFGNSDGDLQMLQWTAAGEGSRLCALVHHTDAQREWSYDRASAIGKLDRALDDAQARNWLIVDMKKDWGSVFPGTLTVSQR